MSNKNIPPNEDAEIIFIWPCKDTMHAIVSINNNWFLVARPIDNKTNIVDFFRIK
jgi:hypothetical protein